MSPCKLVSVTVVHRHVVVDMHALVVNVFHNIRQEWHAVCQRVRRVHQFLLWGM